MNVERKFQKAINQFTDDIHAKNLQVSDEAIDELIKYLMSYTKRKQLLFEINTGQKTEEDLALAFSKLAALSLDNAAHRKSKTVNTEDVKVALSKLYCHFWPFCH